MLHKQLGIPVGKKIPLGLLTDIANADIGTKVKFGMDYDYTGEISAVCIRETSEIDNKTVTYEVSYFKDAEIKTIWLYERNLKIVKNVSKGIGFISEENFQ